MSKSKNNSKPAQNPQVNENKITESTVNSQTVINNEDEIIDLEPIDESDEDSDTDTTVPEIKSEVVENPKVKKALIFKSLVAVKLEGTGNKFMPDRTKVTFISYLGDNAIVMDYGVKYIVPKDSIILC